MRKRHQVVGEEGAFEILLFLSDHQQCPLDQVLDEFSDALGGERVQELVSMLNEAWFLELANDTVRITEDGIEAALLTKVINGTPLEGVIDQLSLRLKSRFSLITKDVTEAFFRILSQTKSARELLICSPWIRLDERQIETLREQVEQGTRISAIIRPPRLLKRSNVPTAWKSQVIQTAREMIGNGIELVQHPDVHTKLYLFEAGPDSSAIFGSENLTGAGNTELALHISDDAVLKKLYSYWNDVFAQSELIDIGDLIE